ncbi:MAG TPA: peptidylprolyl isomerase [bacterium]|nr:peptidylprolyl isomerase [bacterium]
MRNLVLVSVFTLVAALVGCKGASQNSIDLFPTSGGEVIAEFDGVKITDQYLKAYVDQLNPYLKARYNTPEKKEELISKIIEGELLAREALKKGAINDPILLTKLKSTISRHYQSVTLQKEIEGNIKIGDDEMKKYFDEHVKEFVQAEKVKASHILVKFDKNKAGDREAKMATAKKVLAEVKKKANDPNSFNDLVTKYSEDEGSKRRGGDVGFFEKTEEGGRMAKEFADAAFALKNIGDISELVESPFGFHIVKLTARREKVEKSFDEVKSRIESTLKAEKRKGSYDETVENIKKGLNFKFNKEALAKFDLGVADKVDQANQEFEKNNNQPTPPGAKPLNPVKLQEAMKNRPNLNPAPGKAPAPAPAPAQQQ